MDYDDNDFQSQNLHLAGEGGNKFSPVLQPYALPKFDFDDGLHGSLRFDSLVETEVFLGIESNEDNHWIEDFSRGTSAIQFSSSAAESCPISRRNNVWSEATSSESVEMLLKSVGQEDTAAVCTNFKESDACDELGCILKHMEPSLKQDNNTLSKVEENSEQTKFLPGENLENFCVLHDVGGQQPRADDTSLDHKGDTSADRDLGPLSDQSATSVEARQSVLERCEFIDGKSNQSDIDDVVIGSLNNSPQKGAASGMQGVATVQNITTTNDELKEKDEPNNMNDNADDTKDVLETETSEELAKHVVLSQDGRTEDKNTYLSTAVESIEEASIIGTSSSDLGEPSCTIPKRQSSLPEDLVIDYQSRVDPVGVSGMAIVDNPSFKGHEIENSNGSQLFNNDLAIKCEGSHLSAEEIEPSEVKVCGTNDSNSGDNSSSAAVCSSTEVVGESHAEGHAAPSILAEPMQVCGKDMVPVEGKDSIELPSGNVSTESELTALRLQSDAAAGHKSASDVSCKHTHLVTCDTMDGVPVPSRNGTIDHKDVRMSPLNGMGLSLLDNEKGTSDKISVESSLSGPKNSSQLIAGLDPVSESEKGASPGVTEQLINESAEQSPSTVDAGKTESPNKPQSEAITKVIQDCTEEMEVHSVLPGSTENKGDDTETSVKENDETKSSEVIDLTVYKNKMKGAVTSTRENCQQDTCHEVQEENEAVIVPVNENDGKTAVSRKNDCGSRADDVKLATGSPTIIQENRDFPSESDKVGANCSMEQTAVADSTPSKGLSASQDVKQNNASKDDSSFTFEVVPMTNLPQKEAGNKWQPFLKTPPSKVSLNVSASPSAVGLVQIDHKVAQDLSHGSPKGSDVVIVRSGAKGTTERKTRRSSGKTMGKESARKGNLTKETASLRLEKGEKLSNVSPNPSGISQHVQSNEMQRYGHVDSSSMKPFVLASSTSSLPDLNSSASQSVMFQQPFTDLQQVQLRAQIFVYGALIQGTAPDEAYMISAFGGPDGGKSIWENALRTSIERLHGQKPHPMTPETPLLSRPGARALDQAIKQGAVQSKVIPLPIGRTSNKSTTIVNPSVPLSSPLWSLTTPSGDTFQSSSTPRGPVIDHQRALSPLHPQQASPMRNFAGNPWVSPAPFCGSWVTSPQTSAFDTSGRFSMQLPITEPVQLTPVKELSMPIASGATHASPGPVVQGGVSATVLTGSFPAPDVKKIAVLSGQTPTESKPRKRKKAPVSKSNAQDILPPLPQTESVPVPVVTSHSSTSVATMTPIVFVSKAPMENFVTSVSPTPAGIRKGTQITERRNGLSKEAIDKVKEARAQAEDAATLAAAAVSHSLEIWSQLDKQRNSGLLPDAETKLASAAVVIAAAAAVAKAAAAAANVASNAALQAKLMADEVVVSVGYANPSQDDAISVSQGMKNLGTATPASILKGDDWSNSSSSILVAARETARRRVEAASAAARRAENMDAIVKAAELAAEAVSQAGKIVAMGDPLPLNELVAAGPESYWKVAQVSNELGSKSNDTGGKAVNIDRVGEGPDASALSGKKEKQVTNHGKSPALTEGYGEEHVSSVDGFLDSGAANAKDANGHKGCKASEFENGSRSSETIVHKSIKEGSHVEVFKEGNGFKPAWFLADVVGLKDGNAYVSYTDLTTGEGSEKLKEWVAIKGEGERAAKIRIARPITAMPFEGTRKRRRAAMGEYHWSVGDRVDAWMQDCWWEGVVAEKNKKDDTMLTVHFPVHGETSVVRAWNLRPSVQWEDGEWIECSSLRESTHLSNGGDTPQEKRARVRSPAVDAKGKDELSRGFDSVGTDKSDEPTLLDLAAHEKLFNIGKSIKGGNKPDTLRITRTGLQKEGSRVIFGVPKPGKKRKFMEVSKHYVADRSSKNNEANDSVKVAKYLMPQGSGSRGWKHTSKTESIEKRTAALKPKLPKSGKPVNVSSRTITQKDISLATAAFGPDGDAVTDHVAKTQASTGHVENTSGKQTVIQSLSSSEGAAEGLIFSSLPVPSDTLSSKKMATSNAKPQRVSKGKLAPSGGKLSKIEEDKVFNSSSSKSTSDAVEPRRSNRRIQPTSRLLEGLQSSLMVSKIPSVSHDKSQKSRSVSRGNNSG